MICDNAGGTEVLAGVRTAMRAATSDIADEVTTPFRAWFAYTHLCGPQVRPLVLFMNRGLPLRCVRDRAGVRGRGGEQAFCFSMRAGA